MATHRMRRVNEVLREVIGDAVTSGLGDPRLSMVTITQVDTSPDLRSARVYVTVLGDEEARSDALDALNAAHGQIQSMIASETRLKRTPTLKFVIDETPEQAERVERLLGESAPDASGGQA